MRLESCKARELRQPQAASPQRGFGNAFCGSRRKTELPEHSRLDERSREETNRVVLRAHYSHTPMRTCARHEAGFERRQQTRFDQRGLTAAGRANNRKKSRVGEAPHELVRLAVSSEKQIRFVRGIRAQPRERIHADASIHAYTPVSWVTNGCSTLGSNPCRAAMISAARVRKPSLLPSGSSARYIEAAL